MRPHGTRWPRTFRTLATDQNFKERVREDMLVRLLDAFVWRNHERQERAEALGMGTGASTMAFTYVQGMNVLAAPFLYTMPSELDAFFCFARFIEYCCPLYVQQTLDGVHRGLKVRFIELSCIINAQISMHHPATRQMSQDR